jgi:hypothetical protein
MCVGGRSARWQTRRTAPITRSGSSRLRPPTSSVRPIRPSNTAPFRPRSFRMCTIRTHAPAESRPCRRRLRRPSRRCTRTRHCPNRHSRRRTTASWLGTPRTSRRRRLPRSSSRRLFIKHKYVQVRRTRTLRAYLYAGVYPDTLWYSIYSIYSVGRAWARVDLCPDILTLQYPKVPSYVPHICQS